MNKIIFFLLLFALLSCKGNNKNLPLTPLIKKDTLSISSLKDELRINVWDVLEISYLNKDSKRINNMYSNDTFYVQLNLNSKKLPKLNDNYYFIISTYSSNFLLYKINELNKFKLVTFADADTIRYSLVLKSKKYIFDDNGKISNEFSFGHITEVLGAKPAQN